MAERAVRHRHQLCVTAEKRGNVVVGERAGASDDDAGSDVVGLDVVDEVVALDGSDVALGTENRVAEAAALVGRRVQKVEHHFVLVGEHVLHLQEDRVALAVDGGGVVAGVQEDVAQNVHRAADVLREAARVVDGLLSACVARR